MPNASLVWQIGVSVPNKLTFYEKKCDKLSTYAGNNAWGSSSPKIEKYQPNHCFFGAGVMNYVGWEGKRPKTAPTEECDGGSAVRGRGRRKCRNWRWCCRFFDRSLKADHPLVSHYIALGKEKIRAFKKCCMQYNFRIFRCGLFRLSPDNVWELLVAFPIFKH